MELTPLLIYESFILAIGVAAVIAFAMFYFKLLKGYNLLRKEYLDLEEKTKKESKEVLEDSHKQAISIIRESRVLSDEMKKKLTVILEAAAKEEGDAYAKLIEDVGEDIKKQSLEKVDAFAEKLEKETVESQEEIQKHLQASYANVDQEVAEYKQNKLAHIDEHIYAIIQQVIEQVTGRALSHQDHEEIVVKALEQAKKDHVL